ncbi:MAG: TonB-dependent receptor [Alphaproteobacteria bacterium]|nr:MAG: TonB-dependent receptor [Alphaproteobacteria bacterium]
MKCRLKCATAIGLVAALTASEGADAQQSAVEQESVLEELVITGIRQSVTASAEIKRDAMGVVDAITAEDIGKFPDTNLAESLQRITGVSIDRTNNEGNKVTVRGFGPNFNLVTFNGRQMPNSSSLLQDSINRSFNFREIAAESVSAVEVYKTGRADVVSGGIGSTINIKTAKPFDYDELVLVGSAASVYDTSVENDRGSKFTPEVSGLVSQTFVDRKFGVLVSGSYSERDNRAERVGTQGWVPNLGVADTSAIDTSLNPTRTFWAPFTIDVDTADHKRKRANGQAVLQFAPWEDFTATADYTFSRFKETVALNRTSFWFDNPSGPTDSNGTVVNIRNADDELNFWSWDFFFKTKNNSFGLNFDWQATDTLSFTLDLHDSTSHSQPNGTPSETLVNLKNPRFDFDNDPSTQPTGGVDIGLDITDDEVPTVLFDGSDLPGGDPFARSNIVPDLFQRRGFEVKNNIDQIQFGGKWENAGDGALQAVNFGAAYTSYDVNTLRSATFAFVDPQFAGVNLDISGLDLQFNPIGKTANKFSGSENLFPLLVQYRASDLIDIIRDAGLFFENPPTTNSVGEDTIAGYASVDLESEFNSMPVRMNAGVRFEHTNVTSVSVQPGIIGLNFRQPEELQVIRETEATPQKLKGQYSRVLPNVDIDIEPIDDLVFRASYSQTLTRADISALFPSINVGARPMGPFNASRGNPNLLPLESENLDFSLEWYYDEGSFVSVAYFRKDVVNFIGSTTVRGTVEDVNGNPLTDPSVNPRPGCPDASAVPNPNCLSRPDDPVVIFDISTPGNLDNAKVRGWEFNIQHLFGESGFGVILNYTLVNGDAKFDVFSLERTLALTGLSDSANVIGFFEKYGFQVRAAFNWRDDFLLTTRQPQVGGEPTFTEDFGQLDISASYDITDNFSVFVEGINVTNSTTRRHGRFKNQLVDAEQFSPRYTFGVRARY